MNETERIVAEYDAIERLTYALVVAESKAERDAALAAYYGKSPERDAAE